MLTNPGRSDRWPERAAWAVDLIVAVLAAVVLLPTSVTAISHSPIGAVWTVLDLAAVIALHTLVAAARRIPRTTFATGSVAMLLLAASEQLTTSGITVPAVLLPSSLLFFYLLYVVALRCDSRTALLGLGVGLAGAALVSARLALLDDWGSRSGTGAPGWLVLTGIAVVGPVAAWALGRLRSTRAAYLQELQVRARRNEQDQQRALEDAADAERARIAAEMHDVVSHSLAVIVSQAEGGRMAIGDESARRVLQTISSTGRTALADMRSMLGVLRSDDVRTGSPLPDASGIPSLVAGSGAELIEYGDPAPVSTAVGLAAYRITQESLTNALKHGTGPARVHLDWRDGLHLTITNPTAGPLGPAVDGSGISGMRQRAAAAGGTLQAGPDGATWQVTARLPLVGG